MVTYDILILSIGLALMVGIWIGALIVGELMKDAIEKQITKKPTRFKVELDEETKAGFDTDFYECPNCKGLLSSKYKHCHKCGQALLWESEKE